MTNQQLKQLEDKLWASANAMRAHGGLKASDYAVPVLGLIFLKFAENKYSQHEPEILKEYQFKKNTDFAPQVITNNYFNRNAIELAEQNKVSLIDRDILIKWIQNSPLKLDDIDRKMNDRVSI
ncbi:type I restriction-modification system subunit M N-terminal domain-containing protein [Lutibacter citreus]|uniref:type I restriction-modification system subunit M N-terminal domain-containing protein n=1 Tax=Lutibacter citreus TaxID=2138210 RepID=UPI000DBE1791|nr:type I restriction-modification system subunit M N-terminal domain-containing protein [Lutibacter citreus]